MVSRMELVATLGQMVNTMMANGQTDSSMAQACGEAKKETHTRDNGNSASLKVTVCILG